MRVLAVDYGQKRIGLAISDPTATFGRPLDTLEESDPHKAASAIARLCEDSQVGAIVLGLPRNMDGTLGYKAEETLAFKEILAASANIPVVTWDERLSTVQAERSLRETNLSRAKRQRRVNAVAAQIILQGYLDSRRKMPPDEGNN